MALVTVQRSPSPSNSPESDFADGSESDDDVNISCPPSRSRRTKIPGLQKLRKCYNTISFIRKLRLSESYLAVKGAALILPQSECHRRVTKGTQCGDIQHHLQSMFYLLRPQDTIKIAVKLESAVSKTRYMVIVSCLGRQDTEECIILGIDINDYTTIGLVFPIWADMDIRLDGDGGFLITSQDRQFVFKPVSVQAMWSALQCLHKVGDVSRTHYYFPGGLTHTWVSYYRSKINSSRGSINEWEAMTELMVPRADKSNFLDRDTASLEAKIRTELKEIMMRVDLEEVTTRYLRTEVEKALNMSLKEYKSFIDQETMTILGQLDKPSEILDYLYLGSEWNASNLEELQSNGIGYILNVTREIDNFFPGMFEYMNVRVWDNLQCDLLRYWEKTYKFIKQAQLSGSKCLVHCKMGISRSATTVIAFLMKEFKWDRDKAFDVVRSKRSCINPNETFRAQLTTYEGILDASNKRHSELWRKSGPNMVPWARPAGAVPNNSNLMTSSNPDVSRRLNFWGEDEAEPDDIDMTITQGTLKQITEEILALKYGAPPPNPFTFDEVELSSRSADSVEECFPEIPTTMEYECHSVRLIYYRELSEQHVEPLFGYSRVTDRDVTANSSSSDGSEFTAAFYNCMPSRYVKQIPYMTQSYSVVSDPLPVTKPRALIITENCLEKDRFRYEKEDIPWSAGTVLRTKQDYENRIQQQGRGRNSSSSSDGSSVEDDGRITFKLPFGPRAPVPVIDIDVRAELLTESTTDDVTDSKSGLVKRTTLEIEQRERETKSPCGKSDALHSGCNSPPQTTVQTDCPQSSTDVDITIRDSDRKATTSPDVSPKVSRRKKAKMSSTRLSDSTDESFEVFQIGIEEVVVKKGKVKRHTLDFEQLKADLDDLCAEEKEALDEVKVPSASDVPPKGVVKQQKQAFENRIPISGTASPCISPLSTSPKQKECHMDQFVAEPSVEPEVPVACVPGPCCDVTDDHELPSAGIVKLHKNAIEARKQEEMCRGKEIARDLTDNNPPKGTKSAVECLKKTKSEPVIQIELAGLRPPTFDEEVTFRRPATICEREAPDFAEKKVRQVKSLVDKFEQQSPTDDSKLVIDHVADVGGDASTTKSVPTSPCKSSGRRSGRTGDSGDGPGALRPGEQFREERRVRKMHGRTHPLEHLSTENALSRNPFYSTM